MTIRSCARASDSSPAFHYSIRRERRSRRSPPWTASRGRSRPRRFEPLRALGRRLERELAAKQRAAELEAPAPAAGGAPPSEVLASAPDGVVAYDEDLRITVWNRALEHLTGIPAAEVLGRGALQVSPYLADQGVTELLERALNGETVAAPDLAHRVRGEGATVWLSATYAPQRDSGGRIVGVVGILRDVTGRRRAERLESGDGPRTLAAEATVGLALVQDGKIRNSNPRLAAMFGVAPEDVGALESAAHLFAAEDRERFADDLTQCIEGERPALRDAFRIVRPDGNPVEIEVSLTLAEAGGRPAAVATFADLTERRRAEGQVAGHAYNDPLTKLPNRVRFLERAARELAQARRHRRHVAILYLDIDRFKLVNDTWGHATGDRLLRSLALRLQRRLRQADTIARVGGDEFVILLPDARPAAEMAGVAKKLLEGVTRPFQLGEQSLRITASLGVATSPDDGEDPETLLRNADAAMYRAKELGPGTFQLCTPELTSRAEGRLALQTGLRRALDREEFDAALPAHPLALDGSHRGIRGPRALGAPRARARHAGLLHRRRRRDGAHRAPRRMGAADRLRAAPGMAARGAARSSHGGQRLRAPVPRGEPRAHGRPGARTGGSRTASPGGRDHRVHRDGERGDRRRKPRPPAGNGRRHRDRRFRHGLLCR